MVKGEIVLLREIIESLQSAINYNNDEKMYDIMAQAEALYATTIPEIIKAVETAENYSGLVIREAKVVLQLLRRYLVRIEESSKNETSSPDNDHMNGEPTMTVNEYKQRVYRVISTVLQIPDASPKVIAEKCCLSIPEFIEILHFAQNEGLVNGVRFAEGGQGNTPLMAFYDKVQRTIKGLEFMQRFEKSGTPYLTEGERPTVFISYNQKSGSSFGDFLEEALSFCATVIRDVSTMGDWDSFSSFMKTIRKQDFVILIITSDYLRSIACMYEVSELMKDDNWKEKVMFAVLDSNIYSSKASEYIQYWQDKENELNDEAKGINPKNMAPITNKLNKITDIQRCFAEFYDAVCDSKNPKLWEVKDRIIDRIRATANSAFSEGLDNTQFAAEKERQIHKLLD